MEARSRSTITASTAARPRASPPRRSIPRRSTYRAPSFDSADPATYSYAAPERRVFGVGVRAGRLYYAVAAGLEIWSVALSPEGGFGTDARREIVVPPGSAATEISKITFDDQGRMILAERARADRRLRLRGADARGRWTRAALRHRRRGQRRSADLAARRRRIRDRLSRAICATVMAARRSATTTTRKASPIAALAAASCGRPAKRCVTPPIPLWRRSSQRRGRSTSVACRGTGSGSRVRATSRRCSACSPTTTTISTILARADTWAIWRFGASAARCCRADGCSPAGSSRICSPASTDWEGSLRAADLPAPAAAHVPPIKRSRAFIAAPKGPRPTPLANASLGVRTAPRTRWPRRFAASASIPRRLRPAAPSASAAPLRSPARDCWAARPIRRFWRRQFARRVSPNSRRRASACFANP